MTQNSWVWQQAQTLADRTQHKDVVVFECGIGPSGTVHVGNLAEVIRTQMVRNAFEHLTGKQTRLIIFSDDMDGLRRVPSNIPNQDMMKQYIGYSLSSIPCPYELTEIDGYTINSFSDYNNAMFRSFLDLHGFDYEFMTASECYKNGMFNDTLNLIAKNASAIKDIATHDYGIKGGNRKDSYCPFLPIIDGKVYQDVYDWHINPDGKPTPFFRWFENEHDINTPFDDRKMHVTHYHDGNVKNTWKIEWAARWILFGVDYEQFGKDLNGSATVGKRICKLLDKPAPLTYEVELFLNEDGTKMSKSKSISLDLHDWMHYSTPETVAYYMFQNPRKSRKLHFGVIPQMTDDYLKMLNKYSTTPSMDNPVWHVHNGDVPTTGSPVAFSMLLNLVSITDTQDPEMVLKFVQNYAPDASFEKYPMLKKLIAGALNYYEMEVLPHKVYRAPTDDERVALISLHGSLRLLQKEHEAVVEHMIANGEVTDEDRPAMLEVAITSLVYEVGKEHFGVEKDSLRNYFKCVYEVVMGQTSGPRLPVFIMMLGIDEFLKILKEKIK